MHILNILKLDLGNGGFFFIFLFGVIIFLIFSRIYSKKNRILRKLKEYPFKKIQLCKENEYIKIKGKAFPINEPFISPIGKRKCLYYKIQVEEKRSNGKSSSWRTIIKEEKFQDFIIESQGDKAIVSTKIPKSAKTVYLNQDVEYTSGTWNDPPNFLDQYLKSHGKDSTGLFGFNKSIRYREGVIEIGEKITILGTGNWKESDQNLDRYSSKSLYISGDSENKLIITDDPKAQELKKK
ncbi:hypothetical protein D1818_12910 [Aquimarina sp. BL5]|uniref:GIDE domain-containing protein n=1 Tax=Aquimarina sp. BL5 TaxID=1714860 RepID=UPI000E4683EF|nr:GIDE domain-containing protein [Aquimarina sp. BL5]AXT51695.1 hypothetical protein D1818_12910 [Aquimarina sp. BL5]RKN08787.1 hypothetical protein D7036_05195 [Aquimarina sp. BL5]